MARRSQRVVDVVQLMQEQIFHHCDVFGENSYRCTPPWLDSKKMKAGCCCQIRSASLTRPMLPDLMRAGTERGQTVAGTKSASIH
jgi:hypothetical protein